MFVFFIASFVPLAASGSAKYGPTGLFSTLSFSHCTTDPNLASSLCSMANHSVTRHTWSSYATAEKMLNLCFGELGKSISLPLSQPDLIIFIAWLGNRGISASTINSYLSGIRLVHLTKGLETPILRSGLVNQLLAGKKNLDFGTINSKPVRVPVTPTILRLLKLAISKDDITRHDARLFWLLCTLSFHGSFRMGELLSKSPNNFEPKFTFLNSDICTSSTNVDGKPVKFLVISLKSTKTSLTSETLLDVFPTNNDLCPLRAFFKWENYGTANPVMPVFRKSSGKLITQREFNCLLKKWLGDCLDFSKTSVSGHSFRAGIPSILSSLGFPDEDLMAVGRWSSRAFLCYTKLPRTNRMAMAKALGNLNL